MIYWICGISGSGKSTVAKELLELLHSERVPCLMVDGDVIRSVFGNDDSSDAYGVSGRRRNAELADRLVMWLDSQGLSVVVAIQSIFQDILNQHRSKFTSYFEVHLSASLELVQERDPKGLHARAKSGHGADIVGYGIPYPTLTGSDMYIDMDQDTRSAQEMAAAILYSAGK